MVQQIITYVIVIAAAVYVGFRFYGSVKKNQACDKCVLMKAAKKSSKNNLPA